ncbi:MAG: hypothetical protein ACYC3S_17795 [Chloroflexota bacterium]
MNSAERIILALNHQEPDRVPIHDQYWPSTIARWRREGLSPEVKQAKGSAGTLPRGDWRGGRNSEITDHFGLEMEYISPDISPRLPMKLIDEDQEHVLERTSYGSLRRQMRDRSSTPEVLDWPIKDRADWQRIKLRLQADPSRVDWDAARVTYEAARRKGKFIAFYAHIGFAHFQNYPDPRVIESEIRTKLEAAKVGGGFVYHSDHSVPDNVSFGAISPGSGTGSPVRSLWLGVPAQAFPRPVRGREASRVVRDPQVASTGRPRLASTPILW